MKTGIKLLSLPEPFSTLNGATLSQFSTVEKNESGKNPRADFYNNMTMLNLTGLTLHSEFHILDGFPASLLCG